MNDEERFLWNGLDMKGNLVINFPKFYKGVVWRWWWRRQWWAVGLVMLVVLGGGKVVFVRKLTSILLVLIKTLHVNILSAMWGHYRKGSVNKGQSGVPSCPCKGLYNGSSWHWNQTTGKQHFIKCHAGKTMHSLYMHFWWEWIVQSIILMIIY